MKRTHTKLGKRPKRYNYVKTTSDARERNIVLKEYSLYKPLLIMFLIFLAAMVVLFPTSIFDTMIPSIMSFLRRLVGILSLSAVATLLILPVSVLDIELLRIFSLTDTYDTLYVIFIIAFAVFSDTLFAFIGYKFAKTLRKIFANKANKADVERSNVKLQKYGNWGMFIFSCTPLPFTLAIYTAGAIRLKRKWFILAVAAGRTVKYTAFALFLRLFDINLVELGRNLLQVIFGS
ncbi:MAG: VTT domain-containing protein [Acholeplasmataceae bacterium]